MSSYGSAAQIRCEVAELIKPPRRLRVSDAVSELLRVKLPSGAYGPWDSELTPYMIEPMDLLSSHRYDAVIFIGPARTGKTIALDGWLAYCIACDPADMLILHTSQDMARKYSKQRVDRMIRHSPELAARLSPHAHDDNTYDKQFRAGNVLSIGWPSIRQLSSLEYRFVAATDYDRRDTDDVDGEGDLFSQMQKRTTTFMSSGMAYVESSPGFEIKDPKWRQKSLHEAPPCDGIMSLFNMGDRRRLYWQCIHCRGWFQPLMERFHDVGGDDIHTRAAAVMVACPHCAGLHEPHLKRRLNIAGRWVPEGCQINIAGELEGTPRRSRIASFWMEGPAAAFQTWESQFIKLLLAEQEYQATGSEDKLRSAITLDQGRPYLSRSRVSDRQADALIARKEDMGKRVVPRGVRFLTAAIDVQGGKNPRFVVQVEGHGLSLENWTIDRYNIRFTTDDEESEAYRKIDPAGHPEDWDILIDKVISRSYPLDDSSGRALPILMAGCDSGGEDGVTANAYEFWRRIRRRSLHRRFMLVKGASTAKPPYRIKETYPDNTGRSDRKVRSSGDVPVYLLNTNDLKDAISAGLDRNDRGPGYRHFPEWLGDWFFEELTAEMRTENGWQNPSSARNEAFDLAAYNRACVIKLGAERFDWDNPKPWALDWDENSEIIQHEHDRPDITPTRQSAPRGRRRKIRMHA